MQAIGQVVAGTLLLQDKQAALLLRETKPAPDAEDLVYMRYALVTRGPGDHIFPAFLLDDWGREIAGPKLYRWIRENGEQFPRAEIFGFEADGRETQAFLRELELYAKLPCYAYDDETRPVTAGYLLSAILLPDPTTSTITAIKRPQEIKYPLRAARVTWWQVPPGTTKVRLNQLPGEADPGY